MRDKVFRNYKQVSSEQTSPAKSLVTVNNLAEQNEFNKI